MLSSLSISVPHRRAPQAFYVDGQAAYPRQNRLLITRECELPHTWTRKMRLPNIPRPMSRGGERRLRGRIEPFADNSMPPSVIAGANELIEQGSL
jgi:hypothetical protein